MDIYVLRKTSFNITTDLFKDEFSLKALYPSKWSPDLKNSCSKPSTPIHGLKLLLSKTAIGISFYQYNYTCSLTRWCHCSHLFPPLVQLAFVMLKLIVGLHKHM